jgi:hypothetical protein
MGSSSFVVDAHECDSHDAILLTIAGGILSLFNKKR